MKSDLYSKYKEVESFLKFLIGGGIAFVGNAIIIFLFTDYYKFPFIVGLGFVYLFNITVIYSIQKHLIFGVQPKKNAFLQFNILVFILIVLNYIFVPLARNYGNINYSLGFMIVTMGITVINYCVQKYIIFNDK
ncbi:MAG TPA: GtrA family protein [Candidatus Absconditabacterales bacterium]|nr:GtrA family protein [Candidatus Absconditabacterales bacterium]